MTSDNARLEDFSQIKISHQFPIVLIKKLEGYTSLTEAIASKYTKESSHNWDEHSMKSDASHNADIGLPNRHTVQNSSSLDEYVMEKELGNRKSVIIGIPKEQTTNSDKFKASCVKLTDSPYIGHDKHTTMSVVCSKTQVESLHQSDGHINRSNIGSIDKQTHTPRQHDATKETQLYASVSRLGDDLANREQLQHRCHYGNSMNFQNNTSRTKLSSCSPKSSSNRTSNSVHSNSERPTAHIRQYTTERHYEIKPKISHDVRPTPMPLKKIKDISEKYSKYNPRERDSQNVKTSHVDRSHSAEEISKYYVERTTISNDNDENHSELSATAMKCSSANTSFSTHRRPADIVNLDCSDKWDIYSHHRITSHRTSASNIYSETLLSAVNASYNHNMLRSMDDLSSIQRTSLGSIYRTGKSLSCGDLKVLYENSDSIRHNLSLPDLTSAKILGLAGLPMRRLSTSKSTNSNTSITWSPDEAAASCLSSSDDEGNSLFVDEVKESSTGGDSPTKMLSSCSSLIEARQRQFHRKWSRKRKCNPTDKRFKSNRYTAPSDAELKRAERKLDKKRNKSDGNIIQKIRLQQQVIHEQERGKRLAQEIPGFNWLEEKIRNTRDPCKTSNAGHDKYDAIAPRTTSLVSTALAAKQSLAADSKKASHKSGAAQSPVDDLPPVQRPRASCQTVSAVVKSQAIMTLNTVAPSTPRHSPNAEEVEKQEDTYPNPPSDEPMHEMENEPANNQIGYLNRHIQTAVPPLIPTYKATALPKQRRTSLELKQQPVNDKQEERSYEHSDHSGIGEKQTFKSLPRDANIDLSRSNSEENHTEKEHFHQKRIWIASQDKLSILKEAFKSKLNGCPELQRVEYETQNGESDAKSVAVRRQSIMEASPISEQSSVRSRSNSKSDEAGVQSPVAEMDNKACLDSNDGNPLTESLLGKILMQDKTTIDSPLVIATLLEELMKTRMEVEKLRKVQEQMLKGEKFFSEVCPPNNAKVSNQIENPSSESHSNAWHQFQDTQRTSLPKIVEAENSRKRECPVEQDYHNKKQKRSSPPASGDPNTITIRYTLPHQSTSEHNHDAATTAKLRNMMPLNSTEIDVLPIEKAPPVQRQDVNFSRKPPPPTNGPPTYTQEKSVPKEPYRNELLKLLQPSNKSQRPPVSEIPNLIPSSSCSQAAFQKNILYYGDKTPSTFGRYQYPPSSSGLSPKQIRQTMEQYGYHTRYVYDNRNGGPHEREMQPSPNHKLTLAKQTDQLKSYSTTIPASSPPHRDILVPRNERYANVPYQNLCNEKSPCEAAKIGTANAPVPQTFQPKILIPAENGVGPHHNEWHPSPQYASNIVSGRPYQRPVQALSHAKPPSANIPPSVYQYKAGTNTKVTEAYGAHKLYSLNGAQCDSAAIKQRRDKSRSPVDLRPHRIQNCVNPFVATESHGTSNAYYSPQMRAMQSVGPGATVNSTHGQYPPSRHPAASKQMFYEQRPVIQQSHVPKVAPIFPGRSYSPPPPTRMDGHLQRYVMSRPPPIYETRPPPMEARGKNAAHQSNSLSPDIAQPRMTGASDAKQPFHASGPTSPIRNCSPTATTSEGIAVKMASRKCLICGRLAQFLCSGCKLGWYCSKECQREHWNEHSPTCSAKRV